MLNESKAQAVDTGRQNFNVSFPVVGSMAPNCRILVFYFRSDGEVVADSLSFKVDPSSEDQVSICLLRICIRLIFVCSFYTFCLVSLVDFAFWINKRDVYNTL